MKRLYLVRHGATQGGEGRAVGQTDAFGSFRLIALFIIAILERPDSNYVLDLQATYDSAVEFDFVF